jgi:hypothetical protein
MSGHYIEDKTREELVALCKRWERAACSVGIAGSEYYMDPERVFQRVRDRSDAQMRAIGAWARRAREAENDESK